MNMRMRVAIELTEYKVPTWVLVKPRPPDSASFFSQSWKNDHQMPQDMKNSSMFRELCMYPVFLKDCVKLAIVGQFSFRSWWTQPLSRTVSYLCAID